MEDNNTLGIYEYSGVKSNIETIENNNNITINNSEIHMLTVNGMGSLSRLYINKSKFGILKSDMIEVELFGVHISDILQLTGAKYITILNCKVPAQVQCKLCKSMQFGDKSKFANILDLSECVNLKNLYFSNPLRGILDKKNPLTLILPHKVEIKIKSLKYLNIKYK